MKKLFTILVIILIVSLFTESKAQSKLGYGLKGGINVATQTTTGEGANVFVCHIYRVNLGAYLNYFFLDKVALQPELLLSGKGSKWEDPYYNTRDLLTYVDIPLLVKFQPIKILNVHAGPQFGYLISAMQKDIDSDEKIDIKDWYNKADLGIVLGAETNLPLNLNITVRYIHGLVSASNDVEYFEPWKNNIIQFSIGYRFAGR